MYAFPSQNYGERFIFLARKQYNLRQSTQDLQSPLPGSSQFAIVDDFYAFDKKLIANTALGGDGNIDARSTGALYLVTFGRYTTSTCSEMTTGYRLYFQDC